MKRHTFRRLCSWRALLFALMIMQAALYPDSRVAAATSDFNNDGSSDIVWRQKTTGAIAVWYMNGASLLSTASIGAIDTNWEVAGTPDLNSDNRPDILWRHKTNGAIAAWNMSGVTFVSAVSIGNLDTNWEIAGTPDLNADGKADILWRHKTSGAIAVWYMNGVSFVSAAMIGSIETNWDIAGTADFNADGNPDILWRHKTTGQIAVWYMNGAAFVSAAIIGTIDTSWQIVGTPELNGDGMPDILWRHRTTGQLAAWYMNGITFLSSAGIATVDTNWVVVPSKSDDFSISDFAGTWNTLGVSAGGYAEGLTSATVLISATGQVTGGTYSHSSGTTASLTGGSLSMDDKGSFTGTVNTNLGVNLYLTGKMNPNKTFASFIDYTNYYEYDLVTVMKSQGTYNQTDLAGTWYSYGISSGGAYEGTTRGTFTVNTYGAVSGTTTHSDGSTISITGGTLAVNSAGVFNGNLSTNAGLSINAAGLIEPSKEHASAICQTTLGEKDLIVLVKSGGSFTTSDLAGTWYFHMANESGVFHGTAILNSSGQVTGGSYSSVSLGISNVVLNGGSLSINSSGVLSGSVRAADGMVVTLSQGKMAPTKKFMALVGTSNGGAHDFAILHKEN
jgi:hypothetical protein